MLYGSSGDVTIHFLGAARLREAAVTSRGQAQPLSPQEKELRLPGRGKGRPRWWWPEAAGGRGGSRLPLSAAASRPGSPQVIKHSADTRKKKHHSSSSAHPYSLAPSPFFEKGGFLPSLNETLSLKGCNPRQMTRAPNLIF